MFHLLRSARKGRFIGYSKKQQIINKGEKYADISLVFCSGRAF